VVKEKFGVSLDVPEFRNNGKWSVRMRNTFLSQGATWDSSIEKRVKRVVADTITPDVDHVLNPHKRGSIDSLVTAVEKK